MMNTDSCPKTGSASLRRRAIHLGLAALLVVAAGCGSAAVGAAQVERQDIFNPQREAIFASGIVTASGNRFCVSGRAYYPKTDFLTAVSPGDDHERFNTHCYLSQGEQRKATIRKALLDSRYNSIYVYLLNQGDYGARGNHPENVVTPYGTGGWSFDTGALNQSRLDGWKAELQILITDYQIKPFLWLAADDSPDIAGANLSKWRQYVDHMVAALEDLPILWVLGLEVDEYWSASQVSERRAYLQSKSRHLVGVHLTIRETQNTASPYKDGFDFIMVQFDSPQSNAQYVSNVQTYVLADRPYIAAEFNVSGSGSGGEAQPTVTARSKAIGRIIAGVGDPSKIAGIGNGIELPPPARRASDGERQ